MEWHVKEYGSGRPLILLHGLGISHAVWKPVVPFLSGERRVVALDIAGFGDSPPLPDNLSPTGENLVNSLQKQLQSLGIEEPVDIAGNSMGGYLALQAAKQGIARSVVAISPAGLWRTPPLHVKPVLFGMRFATRRIPRLVNHMLRISLFRELCLAVPISPGSWRMHASDAIEAAENYARATAFEETFANLGRFTAGKSIDVPLAVAFGSRDCLLTRSARRRTELPPQTRWFEPKGWGHVPMWKYPQEVARLILQETG